MTVSNTDVNEAMHKGVKESYRNTNRHIQELGAQILNVMAGSIRSSERQAAISNTRLLYFRDQIIAGPNGDGGLDSMQFNDEDSNFDNSLNEHTEPAVY